MLTKRNVALAFVVSAVIFLLAVLFQETCNLQDAQSLCAQFWSETALVGRIAFWAGMLLLPVVFIIPLAVEVFNSWKRFAVWAGPLVAALSALLLFAGESGSYGFSLGITPLILLVLYGLYFLTSLIIIILAVHKTRKKA